MTASLPLPPLHNTTAAIRDPREITSTLSIGRVFIQTLKKSKLMMSTMSIYCLCLHHTNIDVSAFVGGAWSCGVHLSRGQGSSSHCAGCRHQHRPDSFSKPAALQPSTRVPAATCRVSPCSGRGSGACGPGPRTPAATPASCLWRRRRPRPWGRMCSGPGPTSWRRKWRKCFMI